MSYVAFPHDIRHTKFDIRILPFLSFLRPPTRVHSPGMHFRPFIIGIVSVIILSACSQKTTITYNLDAKTTDGPKAITLLQAAERMMNRRMAGEDIKDARATVYPTGLHTGLMKIEVANTNEAKAVIEHILSEKFTFDLRIEKQAPTADTADTKANWEPTPITGEYLVWAQAIGNRQSGEVSVDLEFNDAGAQLIGDVFTKNKGKYIGIFVRDLLVSKLRISDAKTTNHLLIGGIPSAKIAEIFADDVNAGLFVTYTPTAPGTPVPSTPSSSAPATR